MSAHLPLDTIRIAYRRLGDQVNVALRTQIGDASRLGASRDDCLRLLQVIQQVCLLIILPPVIQLIAAQQHHSW